MNEPLHLTVLTTMWTKNVGGVNKAVAPTNEGTLINHELTLVSPVISINC